MKRTVSGLHIMIMGAALTGCMATPPPRADGLPPTTADEFKAGAVEFGDHAKNLGGAAKDGTYAFTDHVADWIRPSTVKASQAIPPSYCYRALQDILCYRAPMPGWEHRLVAYQGTNAPPPKPAQMASLPVHEQDPRMLPANRVVSAKPGFVKPPVEVKEADKADDIPVVGGAAVPDASHEQLPDPSVTPQL